MEFNRDFILLSRPLEWSWWRHQMETFSALLALCAGNSPVPMKSLHKDQWRGALMFSLIYVWINDWVNIREAGDLRRYRGHYDVIVMLSPLTIWVLLTTCRGNGTWRFNVSLSQRNPPTHDRDPSHMWSDHNVAMLRYGNTFGVTGPLRGECTGHWWIWLIKGFDILFDGSLMRCWKRPGGRLIEMPWR